MQKHPGNPKKTKKTKISQRWGKGWGGEGLTIFIKSLFCWFVRLSECFGMDDLRDFFLRFFVLASILPTTSPTSFSVCSHGCQFKSTCILRGTIDLLRESIDLLWGTIDSLRETIDLLIYSETLLTPALPTAFPC